MKNRVGELWEEWHGGGGWQSVLVLRTERLSFDARLHTCLNIETGELATRKETLQNVWESTLTENVYTDIGLYHRFSYVLRRRRLYP